MNAPEAMTNCQSVERQALNYSEIARRILFRDIEASTSKVLLLDDFGNPSFHGTAFVCTTPIKMVYTKLINYAWIAGAAGITPPNTTSSYTPFVNVVFQSAERALEISEAKFNRLVAEWKRSRGHSSKIKDLAMHAAYQQIIGMGNDAIPLILSELERQPGHWAWALTAISGEDPVPRSSRGKLNETAKAWLEWGRMKGYR